MTRRAWIYVIAAPLLLAGCERPLDAPLSTSFGQAVASMNVQIVPGPVSTAPPEGSGATGAAAIGRYETGKVLGASAVASTGSLEHSSGQLTPAPGAAP